MSFDENTLYNIKTSLSGTRCPLFDLAIWKNGLAFKKIDFSEDGVPVIKIAELNNGIGSNTSFTKGDYGEEVRLHQGDLLFSWSGNPQTSIDVYKYQLDDGWLNQHIFKVTANETIVSKDFLFYLLKYLKPHFTQIATNKQTTGLGHVTIADLKRMSVVVPEKIIQDRIVAVVKTIDDKIEVNNEINKNLTNNKPCESVRCDASGSSLTHGGIPTDSYGDKRYEHVAKRSANIVGAAWRVMNMRLRDRYRRRRSRRT